jgi:cellulose synthase/poly-beta-1,6-N-acetylglucosamine synthase-like glycosyltransferase
MRLAARIATMVVALVAVCCGSKSPTAPSTTTLSGTWKATRAEFVSASNSSVRVEAVSQGYTILLTLTSSGTYTRAVTEPGQGTITETGTWTSSKDMLTLKPSGVSFNIEFDMTLNGNTLTLNGGHVLFDVNNDNVDEETILSLIMARQ